MNDGPVRTPTNAQMNYTGATLTETILKITLELSTRPIDHKGETTKP